MATATKTKTPSKSQQADDKRTATIKTPKVKLEFPCQCGLIKLADGTVKPGKCEATTRKTFAQGHDARLKGYLLKQYRTLGDKAALATLLENGWIASASDAEPKVRPSRSTKRQVKVGRHTYDVISIEGDVVTYKTAKGEQTTTADKLVK